VKIRKTRSYGGFTLVEVMISLTLGTILISLAMTSFQAGARSSSFSESVATIQSNARFSLGELVASIRSVGYTGCTSPLKQQPLMPPRVGKTALFEDDWQPIQGYEIRSGKWLPSMPLGYTGSSSGNYVPPSTGRAAPVVGSSAIVLEGAIGRGTGLQATNNNPYKIETKEILSQFNPGTMAMISSCNRSVAFHIDSISATSGQGAVLNTVEPINQVFDLNTDYALDTRVFSYRRALFFIGETGRFTQDNEPIRSLYEHAFPYEDNTPIELADGVDAMVIRYRILDETGATREVASNEADYDPALVVGVRLGLLFAGSTKKDSNAKNTAFQIAGVTVQPNSGTTGLTEPTYPDDNRIRFPFEQSTKIRNRNVTNRFSNE